MALKEFSFGPSDHKTQKKKYKDLPFEAKQFKVDGPEGDKLENGAIYRKSVLFRLAPMPSYWEPVQYRRLYVSPSGGRRGGYIRGTHNYPEFKDKDGNPRDVVSYHYKKNADDSCKYNTRFCFEIIDFRYHHVVPSSWDINKTMLVDCTAEGPEGDGDVCEECKEGSQRIFGGRKFYPVSWSQWERTLKPMADELMKTIQGVIVDEEGTLDTNHPLVGKKVNYGTVGFFCDNCMEEVYDEAAVDRFSKEEAYEAIFGEIQCPHCQLKGRLNNLTLHKYKGEMYQVIRGSLDAKVLKVTLTATVSKTGGRTRLRDHKYTFSHEGQGFSDLHSDLLELGFSEEDAKEIGRPNEKEEITKFLRPFWKSPENFDSAEEYVDTVLNLQAEILGMSNPWSNGVDSPEPPAQETKAYKPKDSKFKWKRS